MMLYEATHTHPANVCPLLKPEGKAAIKQLFSEQNLKNAGIKLEAAYLSCPKDPQTNHMGFFTVYASSPETIKSFFGAMTVDVRPVQTLSDLAKSL